MIKNIQKVKNGQNRSTMVINSPYGQKKLKVVTNCQKQSTTVKNCQERSIRSKTAEKVQNIPNGPKRSKTVHKGKKMVKNGEYGENWLKNGGKKTVKAVWMVKNSKNIGFFKL